MRSQLHFNYLLAKRNCIKPGHILHRLAKAKFNGLKRVTYTFKLWTSRDLLTVINVELHKFMEKIDFSGKFMWTKVATV